MNSMGSNFGWTWTVEIMFTSDQSIHDAFSFLRVPSNSVIPSISKILVSYKFEIKPVSF